MCYLHFTWLLASYLFTPCRLEAVAAPVQFRRSFLDLPPEIRNKIYLLTVRQSRRQVNGVGVTDRVIIGYGTQVRPYKPAILQTCRQIRAEAIRMFYQINRFMYIVWAEWHIIYRSGHLTMTRWLTSLPEDIAAEIPYLDIHFGYYDRLPSLLGSQAISLVKAMRDMQLAPEKLRISSSGLIYDYSGNRHFRTLGKLLEPYLDLGIEARAKKLSDTMIERRTEELLRNDFRHRYWQFERFSSTHLQEHLWRKGIVQGKYDSEEYLDRIERERTTHI